MATSVFHSHTETAAGSGKLKVRVIFQASWTGSDFGSGAGLALRVTQSAVTTVLSQTAPPSSRQQMLLEGGLDIAGGTPFTVDLLATVTGAAAMTAYNIKFYIEVIKR
jgi:hypothetical protein